MSRVATVQVEPAPSWVLELARREWALILASAVWVLFVVNFSELTLPSGDERVQFGFAQRLFGDAPDANGYFFGLGLLEAPFYAVGKALRAAGLDAVSGKPVEKTCIALGFGVGAVVVFPLLGSVLRDLRLRFGAIAILAAAFGTPFFYYSTFVPGKNHSVDAVLFTVVVWLTYRYFRGDGSDLRIPVALGILIGFSATVRYFSGAEAVMLVLSLAWLRRWRHAVAVAVTTAVTIGLLFIVPTALGTPVFSGYYQPENELVFAPLNPFRMLFTDHRGMFVWSPVSVLAVVGYVVLLRRRAEHRRFLTTILLMATGVVSAYSLVGYWDGTWSFGQRFFTPLLPVLAIGIAGLVDAAPRPAIAVAAVCAFWSVFLAFNLIVIGGRQYLDNTPGGVEDVAVLPARTGTGVGEYLWGVRYRSHLIP